jgi:hypothetical protein
MTELCLRVASDNIQIVSERHPFLLLLWTCKRINALCEHRLVQVKRAGKTAKAIGPLIHQHVIAVSSEELGLDLHHSLEASPHHMELFFSSHVIVVQLLSNELWMLLDQLVHLLSEVVNRLGQHKLGQLLLIEGTLLALLFKGRVDNLALPTASEQVTIPVFRTL